MDDQTGNITIAYLVYLIRVKNTGRILSDFLDSHAHLLDDVDGKEPKNLKVLMSKRLLTHFGIKMYQLKETFGYYDYLDPLTANELGITGPPEDATEKEMGIVCTMESHAILARRTARTELYKKYFPEKTSIIALSAAYQRELEIVVGRKELKDLAAARKTSVKRKRAGAKSAGGMKTRGKKRKGT